MVHVAQRQSQTETQKESSVLVYFKTTAELLLMFDGKKEKRIEKREKNIENHHRATADV